MAADDSFFSRWSRQKAQAKVQTQPPLSSAPVVAPPTVAAPVSEVVAPVTVSPPPPHPDPAAPTLADVAKLTPQSDFAPYMGRTVTQAVKNAAMKKLFADPHFNVMDGLDIYIDDYSIPSPLSPEELKNMVAAQFIKLVDDPEAKAPPAATPDDQASVPSAPPDTPKGTEPHDHPDLQLQPDHAAQRPGAEPST